MGRSARRCDIVICSEFKNSLLNSTNKNGVKDSIRTQNKFYVVRAGGEPSYSGKKKTDKENIACPGRDRRMKNQLQKTGHNVTWQHEKCSSFGRYKLDIARIGDVLRTLRTRVP
jgi:hypothetical protein